MSLNTQQFILDRTRRNVLAQSSTKAVNAAYIQWCVAHDQIPESTTQLNRTLTAAGFIRTLGYLDTKVQRVWKGLELN